LGRKPGTAEPSNNPETMSKSPTTTSSDQEQYELQTITGSKEVGNQNESEPDVEQQVQQITQRLSQLEAEKIDLVNIDDEQETRAVEKACLRQSRAYRKLKADDTPANQEEYNCTVVDWR